MNLAHRHADRLLRQHEPVIHHPRMSEATILKRMGEWEDTILKRSSLHHMVCVYVDMYIYISYNHIIYIYIHII